MWQCVLTYHNQLSVKYVLGLKIIFRYRFVNFNKYLPSTYFNELLRRRLRWVRAFP